MIVEAIRMLHVTDVELTYYIDLAHRTTDAKAYCLAATSFAASMISALVVGPGAGVSILVALLAVSLGLALYFGTAWRREHRAADRALKKLMRETGS